MLIKVKIPQLGSSSDEKLTTVRETDSQNEVYFSSAFPN